MHIKTPLDLSAAIQIATTTAPDTKEYFDIIWDIHKYKWYNWYQHIHIKADSPADQENTRIFKELEANYPEIHGHVEQNIDYEISKLK